LSAQSEIVPSNRGAYHQEPSVDIPQCRQGENVSQSPQNHSLDRKKCRRAINGWLGNILKKPQLTAVIGRRYLSFNEEKKEQAAKS
jgi:hypothetical protein